MQYTAEQVITTIDNWDVANKSFFYRQLSVNLTISMRVIFEDNTMSDVEKLETIKTVNEFHHRVLTWFNTGQLPEENDAGKLLGLLKHFADKLEKRGAVEFPLASALETTKGKLLGENN